MTAKLNQVIAIEKGIKSRVYSEVGEIDKVLQKPDLFNGFAKEYRKFDEDGEDLPPERKRVQHVVKDEMRRVAKLSTEWMDVTARKDWANCEARADIVLADDIILRSVPVTYLLFLEKQLTDLRTMVGRIPVLDDSENWTYDEASGLFKTDVARTHRTKKVPKPIVLYPATEQHPAQTQLYTEDVLAGHWHTTRHSGAMTKPDKEKLAERVEKLLQAVKAAREEANGADAPDDSRVGDAVFGYLFEDII